MISIRELKKEDISIILDPVQKMFLAHDLKEPALFSPNSFTKEAIIEYYDNSLNSNTVKVFIAEFNGKIAGTIRCDIKDTPSFYKERKIGYTDDLVVFENFKRKGIGKSLKQKAEEWFKSQGITLLECKIYEWNEPSAKLSESLGYRKVFSYYYKHL